MKVSIRGLNSKILLDKIEEQGSLFFGTFNRYYEETIKSKGIYYIYNSVISDYSIFIREAESRGIDGVDVTISNFRDGIDYNLGFCSLEDLVKYGDSKYDRTKEVFSCVYDIINTINRENAEPCRIELKIHGGEIYHIDII